MLEALYFKIKHGVIVMLEEENDEINRLWSFKYKQFMKYIFYIALICLINVLLGDFWYLIIFDITFMILQLHYKYYPFQNIKYVCLYFVVLTFVAKLLVMIEVNRWLLIVLSLFCVVCFIKEACLNDSQQFISSTSINYRKNIMVLMIELIIIVMSQDYLKVAQMITFAFIIAFIDFFIMKCITKRSSIME